jgi:hypothetical protein
LYEGVVFSREGADGRVGCLRMREVGTEEECEGEEGGGCVDRDRGGGEDGEEGEEEGGR